ALPSSIAFGVLTYTALGPEYAGLGAMAGFLGAAALGIVAPSFGRTAGLISAPCAPAAAVLSALIAGLLGGKAGAALAPQDILALLALTALLAAGMQIFYGVIGGGRLIKFIPYPVVSGYLSGVGLLIALGQLPKLFGFPPGTLLAQGLTSPSLWQWEGLAVGVVTIVGMGIAPRLTRKAPAAIIGLLGGIASYFVLALFSPGLLTLSGNPLIIGPIQASGSFLAVLAGRATSLLAINLASVPIIIIPALTLSVLLSIDTLKTCVGLDAMTRSRHNSNRELIGQGIGNLASFLVGGMPGAGTMGPTLVNVTSGGRTPRAGMIEGGFVILALLFLSRLIAWVPIGALAGILLVIAWRMFDKTMFRLLRYPAGRQDFAVIAGVILVSVTVDLIAAAGVGVALAILLFIRDQIRGTVIRRKLNLNQMSSKTRRLFSERELLKQNGDQGVFCELQGNLFFGTTDQLYTQLEPDLRTKLFILLDMRRVQSMDYTAAHLFEQMHAQLTERGGQLLFSGMPSGLLEERNFEHYLVELGVVREGGGVMIADTLDGALEWMEERILEAAGCPKKSEENLLEIKDFELLRGFDELALGRLAACMGELSLAPGERAFPRGSAGDEIFLIRRGSVRILLPLEGGKYHHLATIGRGDFFGEISFLDRGRRSADVEAKVATDLYVLSRSRFNEQSRSDPVLGVQVFARLASAIAERLRQADAELRALEER
ncbi:MAG: SulP family inorganic anion transporter, partial [Deltaproteobacteria bacterium]|nr:SulP family inorganic anion transporter [Deltaproteobacteria bacterium]